MSVVYRGRRRTEKGVVKDLEVTRDGVHFSPALSRRVRNHSPDGFNWGYTGSGPAQLALALLLDVDDRPGVAVRLYQAFKAQVVAGWGDEWEITADAVREWLARNWKEDPDEPQ